MNQVQFFKLGFVSVTSMSQITTKNQKGSNFLHFLYKQNRVLKELLKTDGGIQKDWYSLPFSVKRSIYPQQKMGLSDENPAIGPHQAFSMVSL